MYFFVFALLTYFFAAIPVKKCVYWLWQKCQVIEGKLDYPVQNVWFSKGAILEGIVHVLIFLQGFLPLWIAEHHFFYDDFMISVAAISSLLGYIWCPFNKFKMSQHIFVYLWGIYTYIFPFLFFFYIPILVALSLIFDSFAKGYLILICSMFFVIWAFLPIQFIPTNFAVFVAAFLSQKEKLFSDKSWTLLDYFSYR